ncbi:hypothetical protein F0M18_00850 [Pseudohalioglobus sediminis]|uniref:Uncharacterized protein n=1 Tax=Pseudohalioglobus sediminis TaxID=2606449 RepID=A0A5B0X5R8_9GAMM|nr:hypothetical protein [Pseudohalioglobus sediminis]KAA1194025.1 hypothetical protein F0M18_00850 [Pseudohalioglobus sediminis]
MEHFQVLLAGVTAVILFIFGLENFSREIEQISGEQFRRTLSRVTTIPVFGAMINFIPYSRRLSDKLNNFAYLGSTMTPPSAEEES